MRCFIAVLASGFGLILLASPTRADTFGSGVYRFVIDFVDVGNADDAGAGVGRCSAPYGGVTYDYHIATYEITQGKVDRATALWLENVSAGMWAWG